MMRLLILYSFLALCCPVFSNELYNRALQFDQKIKEDHLYKGQLRVALYETEKRQKIKLHLKGVDGAIWTGTYLAALSFRYSVEPNKPLLEDIKSTLTTIERLCHVSGIPGLVCRQFYEGKPQKKHHTYSPIYKNCSYEARTSRDQVTGILFGLAACKRYVNDTGIQLRIKQLASKIIAQIYTKNYPWGGKSLKHWTLKLPVLKTTVKCTHSMRVFCAAMGFYLAGEKKYKDLYKKEMAWGNRLWGGMFSFHRAKVRSEYYSNNLRFMRLSAMLMFEYRESRRQILGELFLTRYRYMKYHQNSFFNFLFLQYVPKNIQKRFFKVADKEKIIKQSIHSLKMLDENKTLARFPQNNDRMKTIDIYYLLVKGSKTIIKGSSPPKKMAMFPIPMEKRIYSIFIWQKTPYIITPKAYKTNKKLKAPGIDFTIAYWLGRMNKVVK